MNHELNAAVAEKVMGWKVIAGNFKFNAGPIMGIEICRYVVLRRPEETRWSVEDLPDFSGDIAAAWAVVEKLKEIGFSLTLLCGGWCAEFGQQECIHPLASVPEAICRAALAAMCEPSQSGKP